MSTKNTQGNPIYVDNLLPITGSAGISVSETPTEITVGVDIPSLTEDVTPSPLDYVVIHGTVDDTKKKLLLAHVESLGNVSVKVDIYPEAGRNFSWTKPAGAKIIQVVMFGGGGSGATGSIRVTSSDRSGGGGGGGGAYFNMFFHADALNDTGIVLVGRSGLMAAATRSNTEIGRSGAAGDGSYFTALKVNEYNVYALGGGGGGGGGTISTGGGAGGGAIGSLSEAGGAGAGTADGPPYVNGAGASPRIAPGGGGSGGGFDAGSNAAKDGGAGGRPLASTLVAAAGGTGTGGHGANGSDGVFTGGGGGGAGAASNTVGISGGNGGNGGWPGGGGGGGGAATYDAAYPLVISGLGGAGADGLVIVTTYF